MGNTALSVLAVILLTLTFEGLLFGEQIAERSFDGFSEPRSGGLLGGLDAILAVVQGVWGVVVFFANLITFNVPGAPWYVRLPVAGILGGGLVWSIAVLFRGGGSS